MPTIICLMEMGAALFNEACNFFMLYRRESVDELIDHFISFEIIGNLGEEYMMNLKQVPYKETLEKGLHTCCSHDNNKSWKYRVSCIDKFLAVLLKLIRLFYACFYYYFSAYLVLLVPFFVGESGTSGIVVLGVEADKAESARF
mgnify:CR=1 FL=1